MAQHNNTSLDRYSFTSSSDQTTNTGSVFSIYAHAKNLTATHGATVDITVQWNAINYTIKFNGNDGNITDHALATGSDGLSLSGSVFTATYDKTGIFTVNEQRTGYFFTTWTISNNNSSLDGYTFTKDNHTDKNDTSQKVQLKTTIKNLTQISGGEITLTANWSPITYKIKFAENSGNITGHSVLSGSPQLSVLSGIFTATYDSEGKFKIDAQRLGYFFTTWSISDNNTDLAGYIFTKDNHTNKNNTTQTVEIKTTVKNLTHINDREITLTANWQAIKYKIAFNGNYDGDTHVGYVSNLRVATGSAGLSGIDNNSDSKFDIFEATYDSTGKFTVATQRTGYFFTNWTTFNDQLTTTSGSWSKADHTNNNDTIQSVDSTTTVRNLTHINNDTVTFNANWSAITYYVQFSVGNGGTLSNYGYTSNVEALNATSHIYTIKFAKTAVLTNNITRTGYIFSSWALSGNGTSTTCSTRSQSSVPETVDDTLVAIGVTTTIRDLTTENGATVTLTAQWTPIQYTLVFRANGGTTPNNTESTLTFTLTYDTAQTKVFTIFKKGYQFSGWTISGTNSSAALANNYKPTYTNVDETASPISVSTYLLNLNTTRNATTYLTAVWTAITYSLTYDLNAPDSDYTPGVIGSSHPITATYGVPFNYSAPTRNGYVFQGWTLTNLTTYEAKKYGKSNSSVTSTINASYVTYTVDKDDLWFDKLATDQSQTICFVANWKLAEYKVHYFSTFTNVYNEVNQTKYYTKINVPEGKQKVLFNSNLYLPTMSDIAATRTAPNGYGFAGWYFFAEDVSSEEKNVELTGEPLMSIDVQSANYASINGTNVMTGMLVNEISTYHYSGDLYAYAYYRPFNYKIRYNFPHTSNILRLADWLLGTEYTSTHDVDYTKVINIVSRNNSELIYDDYEDDTITFNDMFQPRTILKTNRE